MFIWTSGAWCRNGFLTCTLTSNLTLLHILFTNVDGLAARSQNGQGTDASVEERPSLAHRMERWTNHGHNNSTTNIHEYDHYAAWLIEGKERGIKHNVKEKDIGWDQKEALRSLSMNSIVFRRARVEERDKTWRPHNAQICPSTALQRTHLDWYMPALYQTSIKATSRTSNFSNTNLFSNNSIRHNITLPTRNWILLYQSTVLRSVAIWWWRSGDDSNLLRHSGDQVSNR